MMNPAIIAAIAASHTATRTADAARQTEQACLDAFRVHDATAADRAINPARLGPIDADAVARLVERGLVRDAGRGRLYLDERAVVRARQAATSPATRQRKAWTVFLALALAILGALLVLAASVRTEG